MTDILRLDIVITCIDLYNDIFVTKHDFLKELE